MSDMASRGLEPAEARPYVLPEQRTRGAAIAAFAVLGAASLWHVAALLGFSFWAIRYPYGLDFGEGIVWQQMRLVVSGQAFGPLDGFPVMVINYTPLYYLATSGFASVTGIGELAAGRTVSLLCLFIAAGLGSAIVFRSLAAEASRRVAAIGAAVAASVMLGNYPVLFWTPLMRVDMLALAFSFAGLYLALRAFERPAFVYAAAIAFVCAVYTKQIMVAAPAASFLVMLILRPRTAAAGIATCIALGLAILLGMNWVTDGGFSRHVFGYNASTVNLKQLLLVPMQMAIHSVFFGLAFFAMHGRSRSLVRDVRSAGGWRAARDLVLADRARTTLLVLLAYFAFSGAMLLTIAKSGANQNYVIEWLFVTAMFVGLSISDAARLVGRDYASAAAVKAPALAIVAVAALAAQMLVLPTNRFDRLEPLAPRAEMDRLAALVKAADKPIISDEMVMLLQMGKQVILEPCMPTLARVGLYDNRPYIAKIRRGDFAFFITFRERGEETFDSRYDPEVADAMDEAYPVKRRLAGYTLHLPAHSSEARRHP
ncbi:MAG TPA: hypothetical protein VF662_10330 [Allosphingosinicella sp.]|jgi:hypothetical protein